MASLIEEISAYEKMQPALEADHLGKWALVYEADLAGVFDGFEQAASEAVRRFGRGPYLIRQIGAQASTLPASLMYRPLSASDAVRL